MAGRWDAGVRQKAQRHGRQKGVRVYIAQEALRTAWGPTDGQIPNPLYAEIIPWKKHTVIVRFYDEP